MTFITRNHKHEILRHQPPKIGDFLADGQSLKPITQAILERRATLHFKPDAIPEKTLEAVLELAAQAPSGNNLQPWRFILVRSQADRDKLKSVAMNQAKVAEAPVVIIAVGMKSEWRDYLDEILREGAELGAGKIENLEKAKRGALEFLSRIRMDVWVHRHVMIAFTFMMLAAEAYGLDTAPMEGFDPGRVKQAFGIPEDTEIVALLALGYAQKPDKVYPGRFPLERIVYDGYFGAPWKKEQEFLM